MPARLPLGAIVAVVDLLDCRTTDQLLAEGIGPIEKLYGNYGPGRYGWVLGNVRPLSEPIGCVGRQGFWTLPDDVADAVMRSEEHTSELQSLMRHSYAVFCLKKKNKHKYSEYLRTTQKLTYTNRH